MKEDFYKIHIIVILALLPILNEGFSLGILQQLNTQNSLRCNGHGNLKDDSCSCHPCWEGVDCGSFVDNYSPRFLIHKATIVIPENASGVVYRALGSDDDLGLTCPLGPGDPARCPCATVRYQLFSPTGDHNFILMPDSGILSRINSNLKLKPYHTYSYKIIAQSIPVENYTKDLLYDTLDLDIFIGSPSVEAIPWT